MGMPYFASCDVYSYRISSDRDAVGTHWHPITARLRALSVCDDKSIGIPHAVFNAPEDERLGVIAGLIESDGCYVKSHNTYRVIQHGEGRRQIIFDLKELALSCGISVTGVDEERVPTSQYGWIVQPIRYIVHIGRGSEKFQHQLKIARERMTFERAYYDHDTRPFTLKGPIQGRFRGIEVSGVGFSS